MCAKMEMVDIYKCKDSLYINHGSESISITDLLQIIEHTSEYPDIKICGIDDIYEGHFYDIITKITSNRKITKLSIHSRSVFGVYMTDNFVKFRKCAITSLLISCGRMNRNAVDYICHIIEMNILSSLTVIGYPDPYDQMRIVKRLRDNFSITRVDQSWMFLPSVSDEILQITLRNLNLTKKNVHLKLLDCAIPLIQARLPPYVILEIFDLTIPHVEKFHHLYKISTIEKIRDWYRETKK